FPACRRRLARGRLLRRRLALPLEALLERRHQVDDVAAAARRGFALRLLRLVAPRLLLDKTADGLGVAVLEIAGVEGGGLLLDQLLRDAEQILLGLLLGDRREERVRLPDLVLVVQRLQQQAVAARAHGDEIFLPA